MLYQNSLAVAFTFHTLDSLAAPESAITFRLKFSSVKEELMKRTREREAAPESPMLFLRKFSLVKEELTARAWQRDAAPESPRRF